jgi:light-regulated signal transduction histidine kinase (bacteriophytochrome)
VRDANDQRYRPLNPLIRSEMCVPILAGDRLVGVLDVESRQQDAFTDSDEHLLVTVAGQLASALERLRAEQQLRRINVELEERVAERTAMLEATNKELEAFSYTISHDLRAPLRRINSFAHVLIEDFAAILPSEAQIYLEKIISSSVKMAQLIDGVLDLSRLGKKSLTRTEVNLNALVRGVVDSLSAEQPNRQIEWVLADLPVVNADPLLLQQVFTNLLGNAVKYTSKRAQACIEVGVFQQKGETVFFVRDNGVGFDMKYANNLFSVFQRLHSEDEFEGSGIGLATVRRIIERHGGRVWAESAVDEGATFYLTWF